MPRLLIVDDEPNLLYSLQKVLRSESLEIVTAETGPVRESTKFREPGPTS